MRHRGHWSALLLVIAGSFAVLGGFAPRIRDAAPPIPTRVVTADGREVLTGEAILRGQNVWQSIGGQEVGSVWGHGAYVAPDWTADWLHREALLVLDRWSRAEGVGGYAALPAERQAALRERLGRTLHENTWDAGTGTLVIGPERAAAFDALAAHYGDVFANGRDAYAIPAGSLADPGRLRELAAFFWWTSWASVTVRPGETVTYTQNWPHEPLVGNRPTGGAVVWSVVSFVLLLAGIGALAWYHGGRQEPIAVEDHPERDPLFGLRPTPSQRATVKYFWTAAALLVVQIALGAVTAHYAVEGSGFYGFPLAKVLPYAVTRTWHTQLGIFWIATAWLATGLYMGPAVSGVEPRGQRALVLFCLRALRPGAAWRERPVAAAFWLINGGLALMVLLSLLPVGILQTWAAVETGTWWARSSDFMQQPLMNVLRWLRIPGDTIFAIGALVLGWFVLGLATGWSLEKGGRHVDEGSTEVRDAAPAPGRA